jgi:hypothetical protein
LQVVCQLLHHVASASASASAASLVQQV